jgi:tetratricopeptide (TPR) repeat protein
MNAQPRVFVSYRVDDSLAVASTLARELERALSHGTVFLDHRSLEPGTPWPAHLRDEIRRADVVLVLIGLRWLTFQDAYGIRRLDDPEDWVRQEIEGALKGSGKVIPVLVDGASPLKKEAFRTVPQIAALAELQAIELSTKRWEASFDALVQRLVALGFRRNGREPLAAGLPGASGLFRSTIPARGKAPFVGRDDLLDQMRAILHDGTSQEFVVIHGPSGVGKSELAREYARRNLSQYPGGAFYVSVREEGPPVDLAAMGRTALGLSYPADLGLRDQCLRALFALNGARFLLIYDNAAKPESVESWLPPAGAGGHVLVTSTWDRWDAGWKRVPVSPMTNVEATRLVSAIVGDDVPSSETRDVIHFAGGLPVQLVPAAQALRVAVARRQSPPPLGEMSDEAQASFAVPWSQLSPDGRLLLTAALYFHPDRVSRTMLKDALGAVGVDQRRFSAALDRCLDLSLFMGDDPMRLHQLLARYIQERVGDVDGEQRGRVRDELQARFMQAARTVRTHPTDAAAVTALTTFSTDPTRWPEYATAAHRLKGRRHVVGDALLEIGHFAEAQPWYERAAAEAEQGDVDGRVDHKSLGINLHAVGVCLSSLGQFVEARPWIERAIAEAEQGDVHGRVNHEDLGKGLHEVGVCLSSLGQFAESRPWYERAVAEKKQGDVDGRVDNASVGVSLHSVGFCLTSLGQFEEAVPWYELAVAETEKGDVRGRVDHMSLGKSLHTVGYCLSSLGKFAEAQPWCERAVAEKEQGDVHGRVDHESLGKTIHQLGFCLSSLGQFAEAVPWYERAAAEAEKGDVHGRVDHESLGTSLDAVGACLWAQGQFAEARSWIERAIVEKEQGDVHGRVDHKSVELSRARLR